MAQPVFLFAPGAGAPSTHPFMERWATRLERLGTVVRFDYPYREAGRRSPDKQPVLIAAHRAAAVRVRKPRRPLVLIGKSMGARIGCHVSLEEPVAALVCLGYPLQGMGKRGTLRAAVLEELRSPVLFVQGTRDALCPLAELEAVRRRMSAPNELHVVEGGDHSLAVTQRALAAAQDTQDTVDDRILTAIATFLEQHG